MAELRDLLGTTRKYAVPIGEYLDRVGLTLRTGDVRRLGPAAAPPLPLGEGRDEGLP
jgi:selenocysteine-specific elongation factor